MKFATSACTLAAALIACACGDNGAGSGTGKLLAVSVVSGTATFNTSRNNYTIAKTSSGYTVTDNVGTDGKTSIPTTVQSLVFSDYTVNLGIGDKSTTIATADLKLLVELYIAFFNRVPDADGLSYWIDQFKGGRSIDLIADSFYDAAIQSSSLTGYSATMTNADFVKIVYKNVLGRTGSTAPSDEEVAYWTGELTNGNKTRGSLIKFMLGSAHSFLGDATWGWVAQLLDNKYTVGTYFAVQQGLNYTTTADNITKGAAVAAAVTSSSTANALSLIGVSDSSFSTLTSVPGAPVIGAPASVNGGASIAFNAPAADGGSAITSYTATCTANGVSKSGSGTASPITVSGLSNGVVYSCTVSATNAAGTGTASGSVAITPNTVSTNCQYIQQSLGTYASPNSLSVTCDDTYAYFNTYGIQTAHPMMNGITQTILQVPVAQNFIGSNAWRIPLNPAIAATTTSAVDGPIGVAVNGIPIFNPCKQGGCDTATGGGDTKVLGELDICNGHAGRADDYHYHAAPVCMMADQSANYWDTHPLGWALDGFAIFGYNNPDGTTATRDNVCGGNTVAHPNAPAGYAYHVTDTSPYILSCFRGAPSPDLTGQGGKFAPLRVPNGPGGGAGVSNMTLNATSASLAMGGTTTLSWQQNGISYQILYTRVSNLCWTFVFKTNGVQTATETDCRAF